MDDAIALLDSLYESGDLSVDQHTGIMRGFQDQDASLARLRTDLEITRDALAQAERALIAERAARVRAEGDNVALREALEDQIELWKMAKDTLNIADARMHRVKFMEFHDPIKAIRTALEG